MPTPYPMTPKRRFLAGLLGGRVDRTPLGSVTSVANVAQMHRSGAFFPDVHLDGEKMARLAAGGTPHEGILYAALDYIDRRKDCADFVMHAVLRLLLQFADRLEPALLDRARG